MITISPMLWLLDEPGLTMKSQKISLQNLSNSKCLLGLVNIQKAIENGHRNSEFSHQKWWFSIVTLVYQRVWHLQKRKEWLSHWFLVVRVPYCSDPPTYDNDKPNVVVVGWWTWTHHEVTQDLIAEPLKFEMSTRPGKHTKSYWKWP